MKQLIYSFVIIILILSLGIFTINMIKNEADSLHSLLIEMERYVYIDEWSKVVNVSESIQNQWDEYKKTWPMLIDHLEIDNLSTKLAELQSYIICNDKTETLSKIAALKILVKHIPEKESFIIQNIL